MSRAPLHKHAEVSANTLPYILSGLRNCSLPKPEWTHCAHLVFATALIDELGLEGAELTAPDIIRAYNVATGGVNSDSEGYHHTLTLFFLREVNAFIGDASGALHARATALLASNLANRDYPLRYYSRERLFSIEARRGWLAPDLAPATG
jgi:hypothetical protein